MECIELWTSRYKDYRSESKALYDANCSKEETATEFSKIYQKYREMLYHAKKFDESPRKRQEVFGEACLIYQIVYEYAIQMQHFNKDSVRLCELHAIKRGGETVLCSRSVLRPGRLQEPLMSTRIVLLLLAIDFRSVFFVFEASNLSVCGGSGSHVKSM